MEFIAALRASPNYIFPSALRPPPSLFCTFSFLMAMAGDGIGVGCFLFSLLAAAVRQVVRTAHYRPQTGSMAGMPTYLSAHHCCIQSHLSERHA